VKEKLAYSVAEAAELLGISRNAVYDEVTSGRLPHRRTGTSPRGRILISKVAIERWLQGEKATA
jgi:excisionase family DNA binding protein